MGRLPKLSHILEYVAIRVAISVILSLGFRTAVRAARKGADIAFRLNDRYRKRALENLEFVYPELEPSAREEIARNSFRSFATTFIESFYLDRILPVGRVN